MPVTRNAWIAGVFLLLVHLPVVAQNVSESDARANASTDAASSVAQPARSSSASDQKYDDMIAELQAKLRETPNDATLHTRIANVLLTKGKLEEAEKGYQEAIRLSPELARAHFGLAATLLSRGLIEQSTTEFEKAIEFDRESPSMLVQYGMASANVGRFEVAEEQFSAALAIDNSVETRFARIIARNHLGKFNAAIEDCDEILSKSPNNSRARALRGYANFRAEKDEDAIQDAQLAIDSGKESTGLAFLVRGTARFAAGAKEAGIKDISTAIEMDRGNVCAYIYRAIANASVDEKRCEDDLTSAISQARFTSKLNVLLDGHAYEVYKFRGLMKFKCGGDCVGAISDLSEAIKLNESDADCYAIRGVLYTAQANWQAAVTDFESALRLSPDHQFATFGLLEILISCSNAEFRNGERAMRIATQACVGSQWLDLVSIQQLAAAYSEAGDFSKAENLQEQVVGKLSTQKPPVYALSLFGKTKFKLAVDVKKEWALNNLELYRQHRPFHESAANSFIDMVADGHFGAEARETEFRRAEAKSGPHATIK